MLILTELHKQHKLQQLCEENENILKFDYDKPEVRNQSISFKIFPNSDIIDTSRKKAILMLNFINIVLTHLTHLTYNELEPKELDFLIMTDKGANSKWINNIYNSSWSLVYQHAGMQKANECVYDLISESQRIASEFALLTNKCVTFQNIYLDQYKANKRFKELTNVEIDDNHSVSDISEMRDKLWNDMESILKSSDSNPLYSAFELGMIKSQQARELYLNYGQYPDVFGNIIPHVLNGNGFSGGYKDLESLFFASTAARFSLIMNAEVMGDAGYFARNAMTVASNAILHKDIDDCGTQHLLEITLTDANLPKFIGSFYLDHDKLIEINEITSKDLIGKKIKVRNPITCCLDNGICRTCYGTTIKYMDLENVGAFASQELTKETSQRILSSKHQMVIKSDYTSDAILEKYFKIDKGYLTPLDSLSKSDLSSLKCKFILEDEGIEHYKITKFDIIDNGNIVSMPTLDLYLEGIKLKDTLTCTLLDISNEVYKISLLLRNKSNMVALYKIVGILNYPRDIELNDYFNVILDAIVSSNIKTTATQIGILCHQLIRDPTTGRRCNFKADVLNYKIVGINQAVKGKSFSTIGLVNGVKRILTKPFFFEDASEDHVLDCLYQTKVSMEAILNGV